MTCPEGAAAVIGEKLKVERGSNMRLCGKLGLGGLLILLLVTSPPGVAGDQEGEPAAPQSAAEVEAERSYGLGLASYQRYCRTCHGTKGKATARSSCG